MKKLICLILAITIAACLVACGGSNSETPAGNGNTVQPAANGYKFTHKGTAIVMNADAAPIVSALGEPTKFTEEASCAFTGMDKTYYYGGFYLQTYPMNDKDYVYSLWFADDSVTTEEGAYIGMTQAEVEGIYGTEGYNGTNGYVLTKGNSKLTIILADGVVSSISYDAIVE